MTPSELAELKIQLQELLDKRLYSSEHLTLGLPGSIREEERSRTEAMCGLSTSECSHHQKQIFTSPY